MLFNQMELGGIINNDQKTVNNCITMLNEDISEHECETLSSVFQLRKLTDDEVLLREGEQGDERVTLHHLKAGDIDVRLI